MTIDERIARAEEALKPVFARIDENEEACTKRVLDAFREHGVAVRHFAPTLGWSVRALSFSPITGGSGNLEFLADLVPGSGPAIMPEEIERVVRQAHDSVGKGVGSRE